MNNIERAKLLKRNLEQAGWEYIDSASNVYGTATMAINNSTAYRERQRMNDEELNHCIQTCSRAMDEEKKRKCNQLCKDKHERERQKLESNLKKAEEEVKESYSSSTFKRGRTEKTKASAGSLAMYLARKNNDPLYKKMQFHRKMFKDAKEQIIRKYKSKAEMLARQKAAKFKP